MKVGEPGHPPVTGPDGDQPVGKLEDPAAAKPSAEAGSAFAEKLAGSAPPEATTAVAPAQASTAGALGNVTVRDLAEALRAGTLTRQQAVEQVVDRVIAVQLGPDAPPAVRDQVRAALQEALASDGGGDPLLATKLRQLG